MLERFCDGQILRPRVMQGARFWQLLIDLLPGQ